ncbi:putative transcription factor interactor and regulator CCHC(Zn) family [Helianthus anomalus]
MVYSPTTPLPAQGATSSVATQNKTFLTKQNEERLALVASMLNSLLSFLAGDLLPPSILATDIDQVVEEDVEELDVSWNLAMATFRVEKFQNKYGRRPMSNMRYGPTRDKLICYRCHEPGHFTRDYKKAPIGSALSQTAASQDAERELVHVTPA